MSSWVSIWDTIDWLPDGVASLVTATSSMFIIGKFPDGVVSLVTAMLSCSPHLSMWSAELVHLPWCSPWEESAPYKLGRIFPKDFWQPANIWSSVHHVLRIPLTSGKSLILNRNKPWVFELQFPFPFPNHWLKLCIPPRCLSHENRTWRL